MITLDLLSDGTTGISPIAPAEDPELLKGFSWIYDIEPMKRIPKNDSKTPRSMIKPYEKKSLSLNKDRSLPNLRPQFSQKHSLNHSFAKVDSESSKKNQKNVGQMSLIDRYTSRVGGKSISFYSNLNKKPL